MKQKKLSGALLLPLVVAAFAALFFSCNKDISVPADESKTSNPPSNRKANLTAVIDGDSFKSSQATAVLSDSGFYISGISMGGDRIQLMMKNGDEPGLYVINNKSKHYAVYRESGVEYRSDSTHGSGQIRVTNLDTINHVISGTFAFTGERNNGAIRNVNGGDFNITYTVTITPPIDENDTVFSTNPKKGLNKMSAIIVGSDTIDFEHVESFQYLNNLYMTGYTDDEERIMITVAPDEPAGMVQLVGNFGTNSAYYRSPIPSSLEYAAEAGSSTLTITSNDLAQRRIVGTFFFKGKVAGGTANKQINSGTLTIYY